VPAGEHLDHSPGAPRLFGRLKQSCEQHCCLLKERLVWMGLALCDQNPGECEMLDFQPFCESVVDTQAALLDPVRGSSKIATG
jgi:hypothetical protein